MQRSSYNIKTVAVGFQTPAIFLKMLGKASVVWEDPSPIIPSGFIFMPVRFFFVCLSVFLNEINNGAIKVSHRWEVEGIK